MSTKKSKPRALRGGNFEISCTAKQKENYLLWAKKTEFTTLSGFAIAAMNSFTNIDLSAIDVIKDNIELKLNKKRYYINEINKIGNNLNQISAYINNCHSSYNTIDLIEVYQKLFEISISISLLFQKLKESKND